RWPTGRGRDAVASRPRRRVRSDGDAEVLRDTGQAGAVALADGAELPLRAVAVQLAEHHGGLGGGVLGQVVAGQLLAVGAVDHADVGVAHLAEGLAAG